LVKDPRLRDPRLRVETLLAFSDVLLARRFRSAAARAALDARRALRRAPARQRAELLELESRVAAQERRVAAARGRHRSAR
jgi:hypothetical protein